MAADGFYAAREYMPGRLMTDLGLDAAPVREVVRNLAVCGGEIRGKTISSSTNDDAGATLDGRDPSGGEGCKV